MVGPKTQRAIHDELQEAKLWGNIKRKALEDPELQELLNQVVVYYLLKYKDDAIKFNIRIGDV